jgi:translation elongation factor EF-G
MYVTNTINDPDKNNIIYRLARIYSGTLTKGDKVKIFDRKYKFGSKSNIFYGSIK